jgi:EAL domain-containing protein (putative c-di-GMP-specific phosphodiesterase class I)
MYQTKAQGKNGVLKFLPSMNSTHFARLSLENDLRRALQDGDHFELHFQPQVSLAARRVVGIEALIRWHHPEQGLIGPDVFIPIAEETGLILGISDWVLQAGCTRLARLRDAGFDDIRLGINLSPQEFERDDLVGRVLAPIDALGLHRGLVEIEITENLLMKDAEAIIAKVRQLRMAGVQVSIDDFGTRYSSLNYLRRFAVSSIKIDQSFVRDLNAAYDSTPIVQAILGIAQSFDLHVVAEGIETEAQHAALAALGCDTMQGFLFSKPLPAAGLEAFLRDFPARFPAGPLFAA